MLCSRKTLVYLILTLNQCYPDYDFSQLRARHFRKEESASDVEGVVDSHLLSVSKVCFLNFIRMTCYGAHHTMSFVVDANANNLRHVKVWEQNPRYGGSKFLDGLWAAIDEVCSVAQCLRRLLDLSVWCRKNGDQYLRSACGRLSGIRRKCET